ncbi:MAG: hypothetical protein M1822_003352 [Bathelium mastoideum]|nr:MAG: hypothetical protein M1822_003352 [Bathelium mastoideum]
MRQTRRFATHIQNLSHYKQRNQIEHAEHAKALIDISGATFYRHHPSTTSPTSSNNPALFPGLNFHLPSFTRPSQHWAILSPSAGVRTTFLQILRAQHICIPPTARTYPYLSTQEIAGKDARLRNPSRAIQYVGFDAERGGLGGSSMRGAYLSARYEARKEETDFSLLEYLKGNTELNPDEASRNLIDEDLLARVLLDLKLQELQNMPASHLSNGQTRRAKIAKILMTKPELLLLDGPFMGLDPSTRKLLSSLLKQLSDSCAPRIIFSLRPQDTIPDWVTHLIYITEDFKVFTQGLKSNVLAQLDSRHDMLPQASIATASAESSGSQALAGASDDSEAKPLVEMQGVKVIYGQRCVLGDWQQSIEGKQQTGLLWTVRQGQRWGIFGANGSGKTTLLSLITSDHPQTYSAPIRLFQRPRLSTAGNPGISIFDIQSRIGHASPEVHTFFPRSLPVRRALESAWADAPLSKPTKLDDQGQRKIDACLRWFQSELKHQAVLLDFSHQTNASSSPQDLQKVYDKTIEDSGSLHWATQTKFGELSFSAQRVILFLRSIIRNPDIVILDEAFSGMDDWAKQKCNLFLSHGENRFLQEPRGETVEPQSLPSLQSQLGLVHFHGLHTNQALLVVSHLKEEVPDCVRQWITLPEPGTTAPRTGRLQGPLNKQQGAWNEIWDTDL